MYDKIFLILKLMRFDTPTGFLLIFFPAAFGHALAANKDIDYNVLFLLFIGSVCARSVGCIINDLFDAKIDIYVRRTRSRPIASNSISFNIVIVLLLILMLLCLLILFRFPSKAIIVGFIGALMMFIYPITKRITHFPQIFLGITFNLGALIGYASVSNELNVSAFVIYIACCLWTIGYDTIYAFMDLKDDKKIHVRSMAIFLEHRNYKTWILTLYIAFLCMFYLATILSKIEINWIIMFLALIILLFQSMTLKHESFANCYTRFNLNTYVGFFLAISMLL